MLDPLIFKTIAAGFGLLFLLAGLHKLAGMTQFRATLAAYRVLPDRLTAGAAGAIAVVELLLGGSWLLNDQRPAMTAVASAVLLAAYSAAIGLNLYRGRVHIDCGCGFGGASGDGQPLSTGLLARNGVLLLAALTATLPVAARPLGMADYVVLFAALAATVLLYAAANQLLSNGSAIGAWRNQRWKDDDE